MMIVESDARADRLLREEPMNPHRRTSPLSSEPRSRRDDRSRPSLLQRIRRRLGFGRRHEELELPWFLDGVTVLSPEGSAEVLNEIENGSPLTPERAAMFERMERRARVRREREEAELPWLLDGITVLTPEGSAEVLEEIRNGSPDTPERRAMFARMDQRAGILERLAAENHAVKSG